MVAMARLEQGECVQSPDTWQVLFGDCLFPHDAGACLGWCACLKNCWGFGPNGLGGFARSHNSTGVVLQLLLVGPLTECGLVALTGLGEMFGDGHGYEFGRQTLGSPTSGAWHCSVGPVWIRLYSQCSADSAEQDNCRHGA